MCAKFKPSSNRPDPNAKWELFIALEVPDVLKKELLTQERKIPFWRWIDPKLLVMPLCKIGPVEQEKALSLEEPFLDAFFGFRMIRFTPEGYGFSPNIAKADSFHIAMQCSHAFEELAAAVDSFAEEHFQKKKRGSFRANLPIMELLKPPVQLDVDRLSKWADKLILSEPFAEYITLFRKGSTKRGELIYVPIARAELARP